MNLKLEEASVDGGGHWNCKWDSRKGRSNLLWDAITSNYITLYYITLYYTTLNNIRIGVKFFRYFGQFFMSENENF